MKLILTASVVAHTDVVRSSAVTRMLDYRSSLALWLMYGPFNYIEIVEGSGTPILTPELTELAAQRRVRLVETVLDFAEVAHAHGKGRAEACLISRGIDDVAVDQCFVKATGRLFVSNAAKIARSTKTGLRAPFMNYGTTDTRFFAANVGWFRTEVLPRSSEIDDKDETTYIEAVYERCHGWTTFDEPPNYYGVNATTGAVL